MMYREQYSASRMWVGLFIVAIVHVGVIVAFKSGLVREITPLIPHEIQAYFVETVQPTEPPPPMEQVKIEQPVIDPVVIPEIELPPIETAIEVPQEPVVVSTTPSQAVGNGEGPAVSEFQVDSRYPLTRPEYPLPSIRLQEEGVVTLMIYVLPNGRVGQAKISASSGYPRLDASAVKEALRSWRFVPRKIGEQPIAGWGTFKVRFKLDN